jgi:hypothetical protein
VARSGSRIVLRRFTQPASCTNACRTRRQHATANPETCDRDTGAPLRVGAEHTWEGAGPPAQIALRGYERTRFCTIALVTAGQWSDGGRRARRIRARAAAFLVTAA